MFSKSFLSRAHKVLGSKITDILIEHNNFRGVYNLQLGLHLYDSSLVVDGRAGIKTLRCMVKYKDEPNFIYNITRPKNLNMKNYIMAYLAIEEGTVLHYNPTEKSFTTPYGIYAYWHPHTTIVKYIIRIAENHGYHKITKDNVKRVNLIFTKTQRNAMRNMAYEFYMEEYLDMKLYNKLKYTNKINTLLSVLSLSVNAHPRTGHILLQRALGVNPDGVIGNVTLSKLNDYSDDELNTKFLRYAKSFYLSITERDRRYRKGYLNRIKNLS